MSKTTGHTTACQYQRDFYGNFQPVQQKIVISASYVVDTSTFPQKPAYIDISNFGITDYIVHSVVRKIGGTSLDNRFRHKHYLSF